MTANLCILSKPFYFCSNQRDLKVTNATILLATSNVNSSYIADTEQSRLAALFVCVFIAGRNGFSRQLESFHHFKKEQQPPLYLTSRT